MILMLTASLQEAGAQYYVQFISAQNGRAAADVAVHLSLLRTGQAPAYGFYISDNAGLVKLKDTGTYKLQLNYLGYKSIDVDIQLGLEHKLRPYTVKLEERQYDLNEVVITGEFEINTKDKSLNKIRTLDRNRIEQQGAVNLRDLLSNELNIRLIQDPILGTGLSIQGVSGQNIKILVDGVPLIGRTDGILDLSQINLENIERVEIVEGPMSVLYGTDALGGVINLITKKNLKTPWEWGVGNYSETNGTINFTGRLAAKKNKYSIQAAGGRNFFYGQLADGRRRSHQWKPREQYFADITQSYKYKNSIHRLQSSIFSEKLTDRAEPTETRYAVYARDQYFYTSRINNSLFSDFRINSKSTFNHIVSYSYFSRIKNTYLKDLVTLNEQLTAGGDDHDTSVFDLLMFRGIYSHNYSPKFSYQTGYELNFETGRGERMVGVEEISDLALFGTLEYKPINRLSLKPGLRAIRNSRYGAPIIPSFNLKLDITSKMALRASWARGFRAPGLKELGFFFVDVSHNIRGNEDLEAETSNNVQSNLTWSNGSTLNQFKLDVGGFYNDIANMIGLALVDPSTQLYSYVNINRFKTTGFQANGEWRNQKMSVQLGYVLTGRMNNIRPADAGVFSFSPEYRLQTSYKIEKINSNISVFWKYTGALPGFVSNELGNTITPTLIDGWHTMDATFTNHCWNKRITVVAGVKNIFDVRLINMSGGAGGGGVHGGGGSAMPVNMGRTMFINLKMDIKARK